MAPSYVGWMMHFDGEAADSGHQVHAADGCGRIFPTQLSSDRKPEPLQDGPLVTSSGKTGNHSSLKMFEGEVSLLLNIVAPLPNSFIPCKL